MSMDTEKFATVPLFVGLEMTEIMKLLNLMVGFESEPGEEIVKQGSPGDGLYVIAAGAFDVVKIGAERKTLARLQEMSFFGEMSMVTDEPRAASVVCVEAGRLKKLPLEAFNELLSNGDLTAYKVVRNISRILAQRLSRLDKKFVG